MSLVLENGSLKIVKESNLRKNSPSTTSEVAGKAKKDEVFEFAAYTNDGESVSGNPKWYKLKNDLFIWSGNVHILAVEAGYPDVTGSQLVKMFASIKGADAIADSLNKAMKKFSINTRIRQAAFIAQTAHESGSFSRFIENLNYSAKRLTEVFPSRFKTLASAAPYGNKPEKIANYLYSGRYGNGNEASGDGWKYRGRGAIQITFKDNYKKCGLGLSLDLVTNPDLLLEPKDNIYRSAAWFWSDRKLNALADAGDLRAITKIINGGYNGLDERIKYYNKAKFVFGI